jgi:hypothetical protein
MDSFTLLFPFRITTSEIATLLRDAGLRAQVQNSGAVGVSDDGGYVWIDLTEPEKLEPSDMEDEGNGPSRDPNSALSPQ